MHFINGFAEHIRDALLHVPARNQDSDLERLFVERMDQNEEIFVRYMNDVPFRDVVSAWIASEAYRRLRVPEADAADGAAKGSESS